MTSPRRVAIIVGSLRKASLNMKLAQALVAMAPESLQMAVVDISQLPLFNQDWEATPPPAVTEFKQQIKQADAVLFVTPEYNRSVPGVLKNAIDVGSRPYGQSAWSGKPGAVISLSPGALGAFGANHHLRQTMVFLDVPMMAQPEAYVGNGSKLFDEQGGIAVEDTRAFLQTFLQAFERWVERISPR